MLNFDEIFWMVGEVHDETEWYSIFDSDLFNEVVEEIAHRAGLTWDDNDDVFDLVFDNVEGFEEWYNEMAEDL